MNEEKIESLWNWFVSNEGEIRKCIEHESASGRADIVEQLNNLILDIGVFYWEIGQGSGRSWYLTISPNGNKDLMKQSKNIMENAPDLEDWEFNFCKPPKNWDREFMLYDDNMIERTINASDWKYVAKHHDDGTIELILEAQNITHLDSYTANKAADHVVLNEIGEEAKIYKIRSIEIVDQLDHEKKAEIKDMRNRIG